MRENCKEKLLTCSQHQGGSFKAFFDCVIASEDQLCKLLDVCEKAQTIFLGFYEKEENKLIHVYKKKIYPGESLVFEDDMMIVQDIPYDCYLECYGNLIVVGHVSGCIDFRYESCRFAASSLYEARIRIFDTDFQKMTSFSSSTLYYENGTIKREVCVWDAVLESRPAKEG